MEVFDRKLVGIETGQAEFAVKQSVIVLGGGSVERGETQFAERQVDGD